MTDADYCARCRVLDPEKISDSSPLLTERGSVKRKMVLRIGSLTDGDEVSLRPVCRLFVASRIRWTASNNQIFHVLRMSWEQYTVMIGLLPVLRSLMVYEVFRLLAVSHLWIHWPLLRSQIPPFAATSPGAGRVITAFWLALGFKVNGLIYCCVGGLEYINFKVLRFWFSNCSVYHNFCNFRKSSKSVTVPVQRIDCDTAELCAILPDTKYTALSHVWGRKHHNKSQELLCTAFGFAITRRRLLLKPTLIALVDDHYRLPGVSASRRTSQPFLRRR